MSAAPEDPFAINRAHWDEVAELHRVSYHTDTLVDGTRHLSDQVARDEPLLAPFLPDGSPAGLDMLHLQCHIGTDTLSWARLGARMTGLDMSGESLRVARELASQAGLDIEYVQSTIADGAAALAGRRFDVVYTSIGVLTWLDDLTVWANLIAGALKPGGVFFVHELHPVANGLDFEDPQGELRLTYPYFHADPVVDDSPVDYSSPVPVVNARTYEWSHSLEDVIGSLLAAGLTIRSFREHQTLPWLALPWMEPAGRGEFALPVRQRGLCPLAYSLVAVK